MGARADGRGADGRPGCLTFGLRFVNGLALTSVVLFAVSVTGCTGSSGGGERAPSRSQNTSISAEVEPSSGASSAARGPARLTGKFTASPLVFQNARIGLVTIGGSLEHHQREVSSWQERTSDGGRTWTVGPVAHTGIGRNPTPVPSTQIGLAFGSNSGAWAYQPSLFFTRDGGLSWQPEPVRPAGVGPVAVSGSSTWITGYPCRSLGCHSRLFQTDRVGGSLTLLPAQPTRSGEIDVLLRPSRTTAWVVTSDARGRQQLITTADEGRSWQPRSLPCRARDRFDISGDRPTALYLICISPSLSMCDSCGARTLYRSSDNGVDWMRVTSSPTPAYGPRTPAQFVQAVGTSTLWAVNTTQIGTGTLLRSTDRGSSWQRVLGTTSRPLATESFFAADAQHAWVVALTPSRADGIRFTVYRTSDGGRHWNNTLLPIPETLH